MIRLCQTRCSAVHVVPIDNGSGQRLCRGAVAHVVPARPLEGPTTLAPSLACILFMLTTRLSAALQISTNQVDSSMDWPCKVWVFLQWYNISAAGLQQQACRAKSHKLSQASTAQVIFAKVIFQLSVFCEDGTLNYEGCPSMCGSDMPTTALLGLASHSQTD